MGETVTVTVTGTQTDVTPPVTISTVEQGEHHKKGETTYVLYQQEEDEDEESDSLFTDETSETDTPDESLKTEAENFQKLMQEIDARYSLIMNQATQKHLYLDLNERTNAMYVLLYDEGAPILVMSSMENGVSCLHVRYFPTPQLENCQNTTDLMFYFTGNNVPFEVTEILPQGDLADMAEAAQ